MGQREQKQHASPINYQFAFSEPFSFIHTRKASLFIFFSSQIRISHFSLQKFPLTLFHGLILDALERHDQTQLLLSQSHQALQIQFQ